MEFLSLAAILKGGLTPVEATLSGSLTPKQGKTFVEAIVENDGLLKKVTVDITGKLTKERSTWDIAKGVLTRHISGTEAPGANDRKLGKIGCTLDMTKGVELNARINDDTLEDNKDDPTFETNQFNKFTVAFNNDLQLLGIIGENDSEEHGAVFKDLAKGWFTVADASANTKKTKSSSSSMIERLKWLVKNAHDDVKGTATILMSASDYQDYQFELAELTKDLSTLLKADKDSFMAYPIETNADIPNGEYLLTPLKNMVFGISSRVKRDRWYDNAASALRYKFVVYPDYEFDIHKYVTRMGVTELVITSYETSVAVGATSQRTVQSAGGLGIAGVEAISLNTDVATVAYNSATGVITITGEAEGATSVVVDDGSSKKYIAVTVTAA